jgi:hypothetical protein
MKNTMKYILLTLLIGSSFISSAQKLKFKVTGHKDTTVHLVKYYGSKLFYADTVEMKNGMFEFDGSKQEPGILGVLFPGQKFFEFVYNKEEIQIETAFPDFVNTMKVKKSEENKIFLDYILYIQAKKGESQKHIDERSKLKPGEDRFQELSNKIDSLNKLGN